MKNFLLLLFGILLIGLLSYICFENKLKPITNDLINRTNKKLEENKFYGFDIDIVGDGYKTKLFVKISGSVISEKEKERVLSIAKSVYGVYGVVDNIKVEKEEVLEKKLVFEPVVKKKPFVDSCQERLSALLDNSGINFESAKDYIKEESYPLLEEIANILKECERYVSSITIEGYTDSDGRKRDNLLLSQKRAESVKNYLVEKFNIDESKLKAIGYGESNPIADNHTEDGKSKNRRIEFKLNIN
jgi:outer membrane protein OmpA-like peptidoglycan-associated protein